MVKNVKAGKKQLLSVQEVADLFGYRQQSIRRWLESGLPVSQSKPVRVALNDLIQWREEYWKQKIEDTLDSITESGDEFDKRFRKARAEKLEMENARNRGELILVEGVKDLISATEGMTVRALRNLERSLPPILTALSDERETAQEIREVVENIIEERGRMQVEWFEGVEKEVVDGSRHSADTQDKSPTDYFPKL